MTYQILICSQDAVFAHMLELELSMQGYTVRTAEQFPKGDFAEVVLLDLDSASAPPVGVYRRMIGFTRGITPSEETARRRCSVILRRPFELRLLRREISGGPELAVQGGSVTAVRTPHLTRNATDGAIYLDDEPLSLTPVEARVLDSFMARRGEIVTREQLAALIGESTANKAEVYVCYLRRKMAAVTSVPLLKTVRGKGYVLK